MENNEQMLSITKKFLNYDDEQMELFQSNPRNIEILPKVFQLINTSFVFEVVDAHGCVCQHTSGQRIIIHGDGSLQAKNSPDKICIYLLHAIAPLINAAQEFVYEGIDPKKLKFKRLGCFDVGVKCGGVGHVIVELSDV